MKIFVSDIPVSIDERIETDSSTYDQVLSGDKIMSHSNWEGNILIKSPSQGNLWRLLHAMTQESPIGLKRLDVEGINEIKPISNDFTLVPAAGGIVQRDGDFLMIHRLGKWDFPKGKQEGGETEDFCAQREVEEETGVIVDLGKRIMDVWHTYPFKGQSALKKTSWYHMNCVDDSLAAPQNEEGIEELKWMNVNEVKEALKSSYESLQYLFSQYLKQRRLD